MYVLLSIHETKHFNMRGYDEWLAFGTSVTRPLEDLQFSDLKVDALFKKEVELSSLFLVTSKVELSIF